MLIGFSKKCFHSSNRDDDDNSTFSDWTKMLSGYLRKSSGDIRKSSSLHHSPRKTSTDLRGQFR